MKTFSSYLLPLLGIAITAATLWIAIDACRIVVRLDDAVAARNKGSYADNIAILPRGATDRPRVSRIGTQDQQMTA